MNIYYWHLFWAFIAVNIIGTFMAIILIIKRTAHFKFNRRHYIENELEEIRKFQWELDSKLSELKTTLKAVNNGRKKRG